MRGILSREGAVLIREGRRYGPGKAVGPLLFGQTPRNLANSSLICKLLLSTTSGLICTGNHEYVQFGLKNYLYLGSNAK